MPWDRDSRLARLARCCSGFWLNHHSGNPHARASVHDRVSDLKARCDLDDCPLPLTGSVSYDAMCCTMPCVVLQCKDDPPCTFILDRISAAV